MPASDGLDNFVGIGSPCEGFRFGVMFDDEAINGCLQIDDRSEDAAFQSSFCELGEETLDGVDPGCRCGREVEGPAGMPLAHLRVFVECVVVDDSVDLLSRRHLRFDGVERMNSWCRWRCITPHTGLRFAGPAYDLIGAKTARAQLVLGSRFPAPRQIYSRGVGLKK